MRQIVELCNIPAPEPRDESNDDLVTVLERRPYYTLGLIERKIVVKCQDCATPVVTFNWQSGPVRCGLCPRLEDMPKDCVEIRVEYATPKAGAASRWVTEKHSARLWAYRDAVTLEDMQDIQEGLRWAMSEGVTRAVTKIRQLEAVQALFSKAVRGWQIDRDPYRLNTRKAAAQLDDDTFFSLFETTVKELIKPPLAEGFYLE